MDQLLQWVKKLAVFMILSSYMEHLLPAGYRRYFHMCTGLILILMIGTPLFRFVNGSLGSDFAYLLEDLKTGSSVYQFEGNSADTFQEYYMAQYREAVESQIRQLVNGCGLSAQNIDFDVNEDMDSDTFGRLLWLSITVQERENASGAVTELRNCLTSQLGLSGNEVRIEME
ncbi:MAG: stage III sporulation protein AF [Coprococcus sp.]